jgi:integrase
VGRPATRGNGERIPVLRDRVAGLRSPSAGEGAGSSDELLAVKASAPDTRAEAFVFATSQGKPTNASAIRSRVLARAIEQANKTLEKAGSPPLPDRLTPHSLRRTFASLLYALGENPAVVMAEMGHTDPVLALAIYAQAMRRDTGEVARLRALVEGAELPPLGTSAQTNASQAIGDDDPRNEKTPPERGFPETRPAGFEPATSRSGGERSIH